MSIWDHNSEVRRLLGSPEGTGMWVKEPDSEWRMFCGTPMWNSYTIYIVDDRHAEMRKEWIDRGKPPVECKNTKGYWNEIAGDPVWNVNLDYRFKESEWKTPEGEDPIAYHAKRLGNKGGKWIITLEGGKYFGNITPYVPVGATLMDGDTCRSIVAALNSGELKLKDDK